MISLILGIILDLIIGDPHYLPHPVRAVGTLVSFLEERLLGQEKEDGQRDHNREKKNGILLWFAVIIIVTTVTCAVYIASYRINIYLGILIETVLTTYLLAAGSLFRESMAVYKALKSGDEEGARSLLSMIVGRDTGHLTGEEMIKATVETIAENTSDGVIAPLLYTALGGPVLGMMYKAVNTMDSMIGYRNSRYEHFGAFAARADDIANFIPSRISAIFMTAGSALAGIFSKDYSGGGAYRIWRRDRNNHSSPNSAQTESVCAGALGLKLGGTHLYNGVPVPKPTIGDEIREPDISDIGRANVLMFITEALVILAVMVIMLFTIIGGS